ncbi:MAG: VOC family protein [Myxococcales bacterium]|nr:VOC family protein [Myxococcales bacterium]
MRRLWCELLGLARVGEFESVRENVTEDILECGQGTGRVEVDLMQPLDFAGRPRVHEPALNHIGLWIDDLAAAVAWLSERGVRFTPGGVRKGAAGHDVCFIHPKGADEAPVGGGGVLIELVQAPPELIAAIDRANALYGAR